MVLQSVRFLLESEGGIALRTRVNVGEESPSLNWEAGLCESHRDSTALLVRSLAEQNPLKLGVTLAEPITIAVNVRARSTHGFEFGQASLAAGESSFEVLTPAQGLFAEGAGKLDVDMTWEYRKAEGEWQQFGLSRHRFYLVLAVPSSPWKQEEGIYLPWTDALELACTWAEGADTLHRAASAVTEGLNHCGRFSYDTSSGASNYTDLLNEFELTEFLARVKGEESNGKLLNCTDCATIVSTISNLLGAALIQGKIKSQFQVRDIKAIGCEDWAPPFDGSFSYHEVAWEESVSQEGLVYDACLQVYEGEGEGDLRGLLPRRMLLGTRGQGSSYLMRLTPDTDEGAGACYPDPETARHRKFDH